MYKVGIIGPESTGKSWLGRYLAKRYGGIYMPELAREFVEQKGTTEVSYEELCQLAQRQIKEQSALYQEPDTEEDKVVFFDTELIVTKIWFEYAFGQVPKWLEDAIKQYPMDVYLLTYPDIKWTQDGARYNGSDEIRMELFNRYEAEIQALDIPYYIIRHE